MTGPQQPPTWTGDRIAEFRADWAAGLTLVELAAKYGVSTSTASSYSVRFGCSDRVSPKSVDDSPFDLCDGRWVRDERGVQRWEAAAKPPPPKGPGSRGPRIKIDEAEFRELWASDLPIRVLAERYGCSKGTIGELARKLNLPYRTPGRKAS